MRVSGGGFAGRGEGVVVSPGLRDGGGVVGKTSGGSGLRNDNAQNAAGQG